MAEVIETLKNIVHNKETVVFVLAMLPVSELRGAIPAGLAMGMPLAKVLFLAILGNTVPVIPLLCFFKPVSERLRKITLLRRFFDWFFERTRNKADIVQKYEALGLAIFVGIPLPVTGAWTGCVAATMFKMKFRYAFISIIAGIFMASAIVTAVCLFGKGAWTLLIK